MKNISLFCFYLKDKKKSKFLLYLTAKSKAIKIKSDFWFPNYKFSMWLMEKLTNYLYYNFKYFFFFYKHLAQLSEKSK